MSPPTCVSAGCKAMAKYGSNYCGRHQPVSASRVKYKRAGRPKSQSTILKGMKGAGGRRIRADVHCTPGGGGARRGGGGARRSKGTRRGGHR
jgi:hypothetical protein